MFVCPCEQDLTVTLISEIANTHVELVEDAEERCGRECKGLQFRAGVASSQGRQRLAQGGQEDCPCGDHKVPWLLLRRQGVTASAVLHLEYHRHHGRHTLDPAIRQLLLSFVWAEL
jgi:hypothetical protein